MLKPEFKRKILATGLSVLFVAAQGWNVAAESAVIAPGAELQKLAGDFSFTEGPACDDKGNVYFTDQPNDRILEWSIEGKLSTYMQPCGRANGLSFDRDGNLWACADEKNGLWRIGPDKSVSVVIKDHKGKLLNGPNDVWIRRKEDCILRIHFISDPTGKRGPKEQDCEAVYFLGKDGKELTRVASDLPKTEWIIGTPDGKTLYVADIDARRPFDTIFKPTVH